ncbi:MAG: Gfo/Idh/MocA family oxidoreductase [Fimbriiglobus sp.]|nr:Gfo/Idh/MocA family oxidoreductase [Fimbriiglobus sp.]
MNRRSALKLGAAALAAPFVFRNFAHAAPSETLLHVSVGAGGMAGADIKSLTASKNLKLVAVADVDSRQFGDLKTRFPDLKLYADWREMFDKEKFDSASVSTPDHMHACPTMRAIKAGKHVYTQKPLTQTLHECRQLQIAAKEAKVVTQMGIQIHSAAKHKQVVQAIHDGVIGKVKAVYSWSGKDWGDNSPKPAKTDTPPKELNWDLWLGVAADRPYIGGGYYHTQNWRKRLDFGTGTFGDMGCHILDPVFGSLGVGNPNKVESFGDAPNDYNWGLNGHVEFVFPGTKYTTETVTLTWYNGKNRPPAEVVKLIGTEKLSGQGSIYIGEKGVFYSPYDGGTQMVLADGKPTGAKLPDVKGDDHYLQWVDAARGTGVKASAPFEYSGPLTEMVLLGCLATRFPKTPLKWDEKKMEFTNEPKANAFVKRTPRKGWDEKGI